MALAEYGLLYATLLGSPWVLRRKSHVFITIITGRLSGKPKIILENAGYIAGVIVCIILAYVSLTVAINEFERGIVDIRSFRTPFWIVTAPVPFSFTLLAIQFLRFLFGTDSMFESDRQGTEGL
jgi:TRAP-type C4-dicarboxylate transport system permease small subunit|tara:strand:- start:309 stop:680 length:372 start_codon:yes stop_codon:yes gene_type:complete